MDSTAVESPMRKQAEEGALLARMDPTGGESSTWDWAKEFARLVGTDSTDSEPSMQKQADEESTEAALLWKEAMERRHLIDIIIDGHYYKGITHQEAGKLMGQYRRSLCAKNQALEAKQQEVRDLRRNSMLLSKEARAKAKANAMEAKTKAKANAKAMEAKTKAEAKAKANAKVKDEVAWKAEVSVTEAGSATEFGKAEEAVTVGSSKSAMEDEMMGKEPLQQLLKGMPNKFDILDPDGDGDGDGEKDEIDRGKLAIEEEHVPSDWMNPSDTGEASVTVVSGESAMNQEVIYKETLQQQLLKDMSNKFDILDPDGYDEKDEIDWGKSAI
ncbi:hypothetical protein ACQ4PT_006046 [Festuca glaucescens]